MLREAQHTGKSAARARGRWGFTLIELLVVVAIISLLVSILLPSLQRAKELAKTVVCSSNLKAIGIGLEYYAQDNGSTYPLLHWGWVGLVPTDSWYDKVIEYTKADPLGLLVCPTEPEAWPSIAANHISYGMNFVDDIWWQQNVYDTGVTGRPLTDFFCPAETVAVTDCYGMNIPGLRWERFGITSGMRGEWWQVNDNHGGKRDDPYQLYDNPGGGPNILWLDGHVNWMSHQDVRPSEGTDEEKIEYWDAK